ncbi:immunoglobulin kappa light chain-like [Discoglossus pictus]
MEALNVLFLVLIFMTAHETRLHVSGLIEVPSLEQPQPSIMTAGKNPTVRCIMRGSKVSHHVLSWYYQKDGKEMQFLVSHREKSRPAYGEGIAQRFIPEIEESTNSFMLTIGNAEKGDEATYYCAVWFSNHYIFGEGINIILQDTVNLHRPTLTLLGPSPFEVHSQFSATFLCHAGSFFPEMLRIKWLINSKPTNYESVNFPALKNFDNTFQKSAMITMPAIVWEQGAEVTCLTEHEAGVQRRSTTSRNPTKHVQRVDPTVLFNALYAYGAVIITSGVYGLVISLCLIRRKLVSTKKEPKGATEMKIIKSNGISI